MNKIDFTKPIEHVSPCTWEAEYVGVFISDRVTPNLIKVTNKKSGKVEYLAVNQNGEVKENIGYNKPAVRQKFAGSNVAILSYDNYWYISFADSEEKLKAFQKLNSKVVVLD